VTTDEASNAAGRQDSFAGFPLPGSAAPAVAAVAPGDGPGYWAGASSAALDEDGTFVIGYRVRNGHDGVAETVIARSEDGERFTTVTTLEQSEFGGHMTDEELGEALAELEVTRQAADKELRAVSSRQEILQQVECDKEALMHSYAAMTPDALDALDSEERHHIYKLLKLKVLVSADGSLQIIGALANRFAHLNQDGYLCRGRG